MKLDGIRIQVHRAGDDVVIATRSLDDITERLPEVVEVVRALPAERFVLDGEALALDDAGRPRPFQETASRTAQAAGVVVTPYFFDLLHLDGDDLLDAPGTERLDRLAALVPGEHVVPRLVTDDAAAAEEFARQVLADGHEGVVVKNLAAPYDAGRRGASWVKVKPVHTLDLVVLAVEWGSGRRQGWLSNIHLGARDPESGGFVMLGKTFKGMTDEMLAWQTERFTELAVDPTRSRTATSSTCGPSRWSRSPSTACSARAATPAASRCASPGSSATATTSRPPRPTRSRPSGPILSGSRPASRHAHGLRRASALGAAVDAQRTGHGRARPPAEQSAHARSENGRGTRSRAAV